MPRYIMKLPKTKDKTVKKKNTAYKILKKLQLSHQKPQTEGTDATCSKC